VSTPLPNESIYDFVDRFRVEAREDDPHGLNSNHTLEQEAKLKFVEYKISQLPDDTPEREALREILNIIVELL
jgi:hypothetical protein